MDKQKFDPKIIVFACNWCSYTGADLAGVSRLQYAPNVRIVRIMCSGRAEPQLILNALGKGADGVLVCGCHIGDCHYISGNQKAQKMVNEVLTPVLKGLGLGDRFRLEWVAASEGPRFAELMNEFTEHIKSIGPNPLNGAGVLQEEPEEEFDLQKVLAQTNANYCYQCSQCVGGCPISYTRPIYNPRKTVRKAVFGRIDEIARDPELWSCLTCGVCTSRCPHEVDYPGLIREIRAKAVGLKSEGDCAHGGAIQKIQELQIASPKLNRMDWIPEGLKYTDKGDYFYFVGCAPYLDPFFRDDGSKIIEIARDGLTVLNKLGIVPAIAEDERCCGHDFFWSGRKREFGALAEHNLRLIKESGARSVVFTCAEGFYTFNKEYREYFGELPFQPLHITQLIAEKLRSDGLSLDRVKGKVTFQDPCRLGRLSGVFDEPREVLGAVAEISEMERNKMDSLCCGSNGWTNCYNSNKRIQRERLEEAASTGAKTLVTACPKCQIHLNCARSAPDIEVDLEIKDITNIMAEAMR